MTERELSQFNFPPSIDWKQRKAMMRNFAAEAPTLALAVPGHCWGSLVQWCSPSAGHLSPVRQQWWQCNHPGPSPPEPGKNCTLRSFSFGQLWCLPLPGTGVFLLKSCLQWWCRWCEIKHRNSNPFLLCTQDTCVYKIACLRYSVKCLGFIQTHQAVFPSFWCPFGVEQNSYYFVLEMIQENIEWSLVFHLF